MTLQKLAKMAGVSVSTVSKAFSDSEEISRDTKELVFKTAKSTGCFEKYYKGKYKKKIIALICPEIIGEFYNNIVTEFEKITNDMGAVLSVSVSNFDAKREKELIEYYSFVQKADAIILVGGNSDINITDIPIIEIGSYKKQSTQQILIEIDDAVNDAVKYLKENGHKYIAYAGESHTKGKIKTFKKALLKNNMNVCDDFIFESGKRFEDAGYDCAKQLLALKNRPTAVICAYDNIAIGLIKHLQKNGINVPDDISVIGINDIPSAVYGEVELTSIRIDVHDLCAAAIEPLKKKMDNVYAFSRETISVKSKLVIRNSVKNIT